MALILVGHRQNVKPDGMDVSPIICYPITNKAERKHAHMKQVLLLGDSLRMGYEPVVRRLLDGKAQVSGPQENGRWAGYTLNSLRFWIPELPTPDVVHLNNGLWDLGDDYELGRPFSLPEEYESAFDRLVIVLKKQFPRVKIILATTMPTLVHDRDAVIAYNDIIKKVADKHSLPVNDLFPLIDGKLEQYLCPDQMHLTQEGFALVAGQVATTIEAYL